MQFNLAYKGAMLTQLGDTTRNGLQYPEGGPKRKKRRKPTGGEGGDRAIRACINCYQGGKNGYEKREPSSLLKRGKDPKGVRGRRWLFKKKEKLLIQLGRSVFQPNIRTRRESVETGTRKLQERVSPKEKKIRLGKREIAAHVS